MDRGRSILRIDHGDMSIASNFADDFTVHTFAFANGSEFLKPVRFHEEAVPFLVFSAPYFKHRHRPIAQSDLADVDLSTDRFEQFRKNIARPSGALIVNALDG